MLQVKDIADNLGLSKPQVRRRVKAIKDILNDAGMGGVKRGEHNKLLVSQDAFELLKQLEEYRKQGNNTKEAKELIREDLELQSEEPKTHETNNSEETTPVKEPSSSSGSSPSSSHPELSTQLVKEKDKRIKELQRDKKRLQEKNDTLEQRLLTGEVEEKSKTEELREDLHQKEIELEKMKMELERKKSPVQRFWEWLGL